MEEKTFRSARTAAKVQFANKRFPGRLCNVVGRVPGSQMSLTPDVAVSVHEPPNFVIDTFANAAAQLVPICIA